MNKNILKLLVVYFALFCISSCTPDDMEYFDNNMELSTVDSVALVANHTMVLADGNAQLELFPKLFDKDGNQFPDWRVNSEWLEYTSESGEKLSRFFTTDDISRVGESVTVRLKIKGTNLESNAVSFDIATPLESIYTSKIVMPVIFHIVQTDKDIDQYGGAYRQEQVDMILSKLNNTFAGKLTNNPVGVNTHIQLAAALYDPFGKQLTEPGINRLVVSEIKADNKFEDFLKEQNLIWPSDKYMNVWFISDREIAISDFANDVSEICKPYYILPNTDNSIEGLDLQEYNNEDLLAREVGVIYKLQELDKLTRNFMNNNRPGNNDLAYYIGRYFGLLPTCSFSSSSATTDYCEDTHNYFSDRNAVGRNQSWYKEANGCYFRAENIMDDPRGLHTSVSRDQTIRIRKVLENCPGRFAWKSDYALTGVNK